MKRIFMCVLILFFFILSNSFSQSGWTYYKYKDFPVPGAIFCIQSDYNDGIYLGNTGGLMKFNGIEWLKIYYNELDPMEQYNKFNIRQVKPTLDAVWASPIASIEIYDVTGMKVISDVRHLGDVGHLNRIDVSHLSVGLYFMKIVGSNGACSIVEKFVKI